MKRRDFLAISGAALAGSMLAGTTEAAARWKNIPVGTQAWCVRKQLAQDIPGTLKAVGALGYQGIELENSFGKPASEWKKYLADAGLKVCGNHVVLEALMGDKFQSTVDFNREIGNKNLIIRAMNKDVYTDRKVFDKTLDQYNQIAEKLKPLGMKIGYHNHTTIFNKFDGSYLWDLLATKTNKDVVLQFDTGNASEVEGINIYDVLKRTSGKLVSMHVKPYSKARPDAYLGDDELRWSEIFRMAESNSKFEWYIIEYERDVAPPLEALKANLEKFKMLRK